VMEEMQQRLTVRYCIGSCLRSVKELAVKLGWFLSSRAVPVCSPGLRRIGADFYNLNHCIEVVVDVIAQDRQLSYEGRGCNCICCSHGMAKGRACPSALEVCVGNVLDWLERCISIPGPAMPAVTALAIPFIILLDLRNLAGSIIWSRHADVITLASYSICRRSAVGQNRFWSCCCFVLTSRDWHYSAN
jgi:hypothetical protein